LQRGDTRRQFLQDDRAQVTLSDLGTGSAIRSRLSSLEDRSVLVATDDQLAAGLALLELDGIASRIVLCPGGLSPETIPSIIRDANVNVILSDRGDSLFSDIQGIPLVLCETTVEKAEVHREPSRETEWVLFTSGTAARPKMACHRLPALLGAIKRNGVPITSTVWATFYDIRRYGGLQIFLRAMLGNNSLLLSSACEPPNSHLERLAKCGVTHLSGTPSHWRRVLMSTFARRISPDYVRLSGEIADQGVLDSLRLLYPKARIVHAYASTEAGVGFEVDDEKEGFPASFIGRRGEEVELQVKDGTLRIRSNRTAKCYLGAESPRIVGEDGFVDTGDIVELRGGRYYFMGRKDGVINIGGKKVHPEEVEAVINRHPGVRMSLVLAKRNPILGAVAVAEIVPKAEAAGSGVSFETLENEIRALCSSQLERHKVPALIHFVPSLTMTAGGKLARHHA
jgi:acyl-coenzyme A synthetase/AMP-(fatty) acid ligase/tetrahydromethanopterin S-methyltransferase subunit F